MPRRTLVLLAALLAVPVAYADGPKDNLPDNVRPVPPKGSPVPDIDRKVLTAGLEELKKDLDSLPAALKGKPALLDLIPDVEVYYKAVRYAVEYDEIYIDKGRNDITAAKSLLKQGQGRLLQLRDGKPAWTTATGLVVRGYRSKIDGSVQPYGLVVPASYSPTTPHKFRLDFWWHGRGEVLTEVNFIDQRQKNPGEFTPANAFVLHPYGRYCNANKFAGEIDTLECLEHVRKHYPIDESRLTARGFSMGGAACWQFAVHYPTLWCAAAPGAGFAETREFLNDFQNEQVKPTWYERKLWHLYDATDYSPNLYNLPTVAYSGADDRQKQAADVMARELKKDGIELTHIIGPKTGHRYEPGAKAEVNRRIDAILAKGKPDVPPAILFQTYTLRYNRSGWVEVLGLKKHWEKAVVIAELVQPDTIRVKTSNVSALRIHFEPGTFPFESLKYNFEVAPKELLAGRPVPPVQSDKSYTFTLGSVPRDGLAKRPGLQGPIDDAFLDRFLMVRPTGTPLNEKVGAWAAGEMKHAVSHWRSQFRGDAPTKDDKDVTDDDIKNANLILWGDPSSNAVLAKVADRLPVKWTADGVVLGDETYPAKTHVPVLIYPNPLNPAKYMVLNSGFTFREYDYLNNARQVPKLPDYAVLDVTTPPNSRWPGKVVRAGFFGEKWELLPDDGRGEK